METEIQEPVQTQEAKKDSGQQAYANDGAEGLDNFLSDNVPSDYLEKVSERKEVVDTTVNEKPKEEVVAEGKKVIPIDKETQTKIDSLLAKSENDGLSEEEITFLKDQGYEVEVEESAEGTTSVVDEKKKEEAKTVEFQLPKDFAEEIDDFFGDDENYDKEKITTEDRLKYASKAIKTMRANQSKLQQAFESSPEVAGFISDIVKGTDPRKAILNNMPELLEAESAPDPSTDKEAYDQFVIDQHNAKLEKKRVKELQKQQQDNLEKSIADSHSFVAEMKLDEKGKQEFFAGLDKHLQDVAKHHVSKDFMKLVYKGLQYDKDVSSAERAGIVQGMNRKIKSVKRVGDGLVRIKSAQKNEPKRGVEYTDDATKGFANLVGD